MKDESISISSANNTQYIESPESPESESEHSVSDVDAQSDNEKENENGNEDVDKHKLLMERYYSSPSSQSRFIRHSKVFLKYSQQKLSIRKMFNKEEEIKLKILRLSDKTRVSHG